MGAAASAFVSNSKWCRLAHSQFADAISAVTHIRKSTRRFRPVNSVTAIVIPTTLNTGPNGIRNASAFGLNFRSRISEAHNPAYSMIIDPDASATSHRKVPAVASSHPINANNKIAAHGV